MSLLDEITTGAIECGADFDSTLRRSYLLATRLRYEPFQAWVNSELRGYANDAELPVYRIVPASIWFDATGPASRQKGVAPWNWFAGNSEAYESASKARLRQSVAQLESWIQDNKDVEFLPSASVYRHMEALVEANYAGLVSCRQTVSLSAIRGLRANICTSLLQFALEIEKLYPEVQDESFHPNSDTEQVIGNVFNQFIIHGGHPSISVASGTNPVAVAVALEQKLVVAEQLTDILRSAGLEIHNLAEVIEDASVEDVDQRASSVGKWIGRATEAGKRAGKVVTEEVLKSAVRQVLNGQFDPSIFVSLLG